MKPLGTHEILLTIIDIDDNTMNMLGKVAYCREEKSGIFHTGIQFIEVEEGIQLFVTNLIKIYRKQAKH